MDQAENLVRGILENLQRQVLANRRSQLDAKPDGSLWCPRHATTVDPDCPVLACPGCIADAERREAAQQRRDGLRTFWPPETMPRWSWARLGQTSWQQRANPRLVRMLEVWSPRRSALIHGPTGAGKTSGIVARLHQLGAAAAAWADRVEAAPCPVVPTWYATEIQLVQARRRHPLGQGEPETVAMAMTSPCLILDEVGATGDLITHEILDERMRRGLPTVALTGFSPAELVGKVGDACVRRLEQGAMVLDLFEGHGL